MTRTCRVLGCLLLAACGDETPDTPPLQETAVCTPGWETVRAPEAGLGSEMLVWADGVLYFPRYLGPDQPAEIVAHPLAGGPERTVVQTKYPAGLWRDGDRLIWPADDKWFSVPLAGGEVTTVPDVPTSGTATFDATHFYWLRHDDTDGHRWLWRAPRTGGPPEKLPKPTDPWPDHFRNTSQGIAVAGGQLSEVVSKETGEVRSFPPLNGVIITVDDRSILWQIIDTTRGVVHHLDRAPLDGGPVERLWPAIPLRSTRVQAWPDARGGFLVADFEKFADGQNHHVVWSVDAAGKAARVACHAGPAFSVGIVAVAPAPDAMYATVRADARAGGPTWSLVRFSLPR